MFDTRFNNGYQNTVMPLNTEQYTQTGVLPNMMNNNIPYPAMPSQSVPAANVPGQNSVAYAGGGKVKKKKASKEKSPYPMLAEMIRKQGNSEDTILAHINPLEAMLLKDIGGSGTINKKTGLPQFGLFSNPKKWFKSNIGPTLGMALGNLILPGIGGMIGGAFGGAAGSAARGRNDFGKSALRGLAMGAAAPTVAGLAGSGLSSLGATGAGSTLSSYGAKNAILPALGIGKAGSVAGKAGSVAGKAGSVAGKAGSVAGKAGSVAGKAGSVAGKAGSVAGKAGSAAKLSFTEKLLGNSKDFLTDPKNILSLGSAAASAFNRPKEKKEKTPEQQADEHKRLQKALRLNPSDRAAMEADLLAQERMKRRIAREKFLPEERFGNIEPVYRRSNTPEQRKQQGRWINYYNNPQFTGAPVPYKKGGEASRGIMYEAEEMQYPEGYGQYLQGDTGGQDDKIKALLSDGEYVIPADAVAHLGDGNNAAGAKKLDRALKNIRKQRGGSIHKLPPRAKSLASYLI